jgi:spore coat polysaccharide biosynthesis protein SpsF
MLPLGGKPLIFRVMEALKQVDASLRILACPEDSRETFAPLAALCGFEIFGGSKDDVLGRFCSAIRYFGLAGNRIIRATGDNPFVFADAANAINREADAFNAAYSAYTGLPYGAGVESVLADALLQAEKETENPYHREHVCPYLYENGAKFTLRRPLAPLKWRRPEIRISVDTTDDYERAGLLYAELYRRTDGTDGCGTPECAVSNKKIARGGKGRGGKRRGGEIRLNLILDRVPVIYPSTRSYAAPSAPEMRFQKLLSLTRDKLPARQSKRPPHPKTLKMRRQPHKIIPLGNLQAEVPRPPSHTAHTGLQAAPPVENFCGERIIAAYDRIFTGNAR